MATTGYDLVLSYEKHEFTEESVLLAQDLRDIDNGIYDLVEKVNAQGEVLTDSVYSLNSLRNKTDTALNAFSTTMNSYMSSMETWGSNIDAFTIGEDQSSGNINRILKPGCYIITGDAMFSPFNDESDCGYLIVFGYVNDEDSTKTSLCQMVVEGAGITYRGHIYTRYFNGTTWSDWRSSLLESEMSAEMSALQTTISALETRVARLEDGDSNA